MGRTSFSLVLLGLLGCVKEESKPIQPETHYAPIYSESLEKLSSDIIRWNGDGRLDSEEKIKILRACGHEIRLNYGWWGTCAIQIWNGDRWQTINGSIQDFPISAEDMGRLIQHYQKTSPFYIN